MKKYLLKKVITSTNVTKYVCSKYIIKYTKKLFSEDREDACVFTEKQAYEFIKNNPHRKLQLEEFE